MFSGARFINFYDFGYFFTEMPIKFPIAMFMFARDQ